MPLHYSADKPRVGRQGRFYLYLWRSAKAPGIRYLAGSVLAAEAMCGALVKEGYIVKVVHAATDTEYEWRQGVLLPVYTSPA